MDLSMGEIQCGMAYFGQGSFDTGEAGLGAVGYRRAIPTRHNGPGFPRKR